MSVLCKTGSGLQASFCLVIPHLTQGSAVLRKHNTTQKRLINTVLASRPCSRADPFPFPEAPNPAPLTQRQLSSHPPGAATAPVRHPPAQWRPGRCGLRGGHGTRRGGPGSPHLAGGATRDERLPLGMAAGNRDKREEARNGAREPRQAEETRNGAIRPGPTPARRL